MFSLEGKQRLLFVNKKKQKYFAPVGVGTAVAKAHSKQTFFASFFQKEALASLSTAKRSSRYH
jgi:hypothetical protein